MLAGSITMGVGQFCTNPGLIISTAGSDLDYFIQMLGAALSQLESGVMLTERICKSYQDGVESTLSQQGITVEARAENGDGPNMGQPALASVSGETFLADPELATEVFGPFSMVVKCKDNAELEAAIGSLGGQLTGSVIGSKDELDQYHPAIETMESKVGRIIYNGVPTGVEVCPSMQHGGPYPAASDVRFTSVGTGAIKRFVRPIAFQSWPQEKLPRELQDRNPMNIWRLVNGNLSKDS
jgi:NADP-dependent aldehyde dehydrogenase